MLPFDSLLEQAGNAGLRTSQVDEFRRKFGANTMTPPARESIWKQYLKNFDDPIIRILLFAVVVSTIVSLIRGSGFLDIFGILIAILLSTGIAFFNEYRSSREFDILNATRDDMAVKVIRDGHPSSIPSREIVVGDLIILEAGDAIPADSWIYTADDIFTDESAFTGESEPVPKNSGDRLLKGAFVTAGRGTVITGAVGDTAEMGVIASSLGIDHTSQTPLEQKLEALARVISRFGYAIAVLISVSLFIRGVLTGEITGLNIETANHLLHYLLLAVVVVVAAVPEGLPMSVALSLSLAMRKMTRANCLVRRLIACETIGSATTICTDKTGTLTRNQMEVVDSSTGNPELPGDLPQTSSGWITLNAAVNGTAHLEEREDRVLVIGNSTEGALLRWLRHHTIDYVKIRAETRVTKQYLFDGNRKRMSTVVQISGRPYLLVKGAPEILASLCMGKPDLSGISALASRAMRTLAFAHKEIREGDESENALVWDGFVGIRDPLRDNIAESVATCQKAGIRVRMVTGDNP
jgi:Ca2+-transporting ATPase